MYTRGFWYFVNSLRLDKILNGWHLLMYIDQFFLYMFYLQYCYLYWTALLCSLKKVRKNKNLDNRYRKITVATSHVIVIKVKLIFIDNICLNHHFSKRCKGRRAIDLKKTLDFQRKRKNCGIFVLHNGGQKEFACPVF